MDTTERQVIDELFGKVKQAESGSGPREAQAEARIREHIAAQPAAPYYMAQVIIIQEQALAAAETRIEQLQNELAARPAAGGFLGSLFGGGGSSRPVSAQQGPVAGVNPCVAAYTDPRHRHGDGFLGGAMQTAMGVAGGLLLGSAVMRLLAPDAATAAKPLAEEAPEELDGGGFDEEF